MKYSDLCALAEYNTDRSMGRVHTREHRGRMKLLQAEFDIENARRVGIGGDDWAALSQYRRLPNGAVLPLVQP